MCAEGQCQRGRGDGRVAAWNSGERWREEETRVSVCSDREENAFASRARRVTVPFLVMDVVCGARALVIPSSAPNENVSPVTPVDTTLGSPLAAHTLLCHIPFTQPRLTQPPPPPPPLPR